MTQKELLSQAAERAGDVAASVSDMSQQAAEHPWIVRLGRFGFAANGFVYGMVGFLALLGALGRGGDTTDKDSALVTLLNQPFGRIALGLVAVGLLGYIIWRFVQAVADTEGKGSDAKGILTRIGYAIAGLIYFGLAITCARLALGLGGNTEGNEQASLSAQVMEQPFGQLLVGAVGLVVVGVGVYQIYKGYTAKFREKLETHRMSAREEQAVTAIGRFGLVARGVVLLITGAFVTLAAINHDASQVKGLDGALDTVAAQPYGRALLAAVALGLIAFAVYMLAESRYRRMYHPAHA